MGWTQEDITEVYRTVKQVAADLKDSDKHGAALKFEIQQRLRFKLGVRRVSRTRNGWLTYYDHGSKRKFKGFVQGKYHALGLPSREQNMLSKMIDSVVEGKEINEVSLKELSKTVSEAEIVAARAKTIASDCEGIMAELNKISEYLDNPE